MVMWLFSLSHSSWLGLVICGVWKVDPFLLCCRIYQEFIAVFPYYILNGRRISCDPSCYSLHIGDLGLLFASVSLEDYQLHWFCKFSVFFSLFHVLDFCSLLFSSIRWSGLYFALLFLMSWGMNVDYCFENFPHSSCKHLCYNFPLSMAFVVSRKFWYALFLHLTTWFYLLWWFWDLFLFHW